MIRYSFLNKIDEKDKMVDLKTWIFDKDKEAWVCPYCRQPGESYFLYCPNCGHVIEGVEVWLST